MLTDSSGIQIHYGDRPQSCKQGGDCFVGNTSETASRNHITVAALKAAFPPTYFPREILKHILKWKTYLTVDPLQRDAGIEKPGLSIDLNYQFDIR